jgi:hypothetical protein
LGVKKVKGAWDESADVDSFRTPELISLARLTAVVSDTLGSVVDGNSGLANRKVKSAESVVSGVVPRDDDVGDELKRKSCDGSGVTEGEAARVNGVAGEVLSTGGRDDFSITELIPGVSIW